MVRPDCMQRTSELARAMHVPTWRPAFFAVDAVVGVVVLVGLLIGLVHILVPDDLQPVVGDLGGHLHGFALHAFALHALLLWLLFSLAEGGGWGTG